MSKSIIPTKDNIWNILKALSAETNQQIKALSAENRQRSAEVEKEIKALSAENRQRSAEVEQQIKTLSAESRQEIKTLSAENRQRATEMNQGFVELRKLFAETDQQIKENSVKSKEIDKRLDKAIGLFETQWGKLMESLVEGDLLKILQAQGIEVTDTYPNVKHRSAKDQYEYDIIAANGKEVVGVEVKTTLRVKHVKLFLEELNKFTHRLPRFKDSVIYGAVAFLKAEEESAIYAEKQGLFVIRATGSSASLINAKGFKPEIFV